MSGFGGAKDAGSGGASTNIIYIGCPPPSTVPFRGRGRGRGFGRGRGSFVPRGTSGQPYRSTSRTSSHPARSIAGSFQRSSTSSRDRSRSPRRPLTTLANGVADSNRARSVMSKSTDGSEKDTEAGRPLSPAPSLATTLPPDRMTDITDGQCIKPINEMTGEDLLRRLREQTAQVEVLLSRNQLLADRLSQMDNLQNIGDSGEKTAESSGIEETS